MLDSHTSLYGGVCLILTVVWWLPPRGQYLWWMSTVKRRGILTIPIAGFCLIGYLINVPRILDEHGFQGAPTRLADLLLPIAVFMIFDLALMRKDEDTPKCTRDDLNERAEPFKHHTVDP